VARSARLSSVRVEVTDAAREVVALFTGLAFRREETLASVEASRRGRGAPSPSRVSSAGRRPGGRGASRRPAPRG
jgi:hypothetical protein